MHIRHCFAQNYILHNIYIQLQYGCKILTTFQCMLKSYISSNGGEIHDEIEAQTMPK